MSEMFESLYDEIFLQSKAMDNNKINYNMKKYIESKASLKNKKLLLKLRKEYFRIQGIENYSLIQKKLYSGMDKKEVILFELARIKNNSNVENRILEQILDIKKLLSLNENNLSYELYTKITNLIVMIEISLDMKIGLFDELCDFFESRIKMIDKEVYEESSYIRKR